MPVISLVTQPPVVFPSISGLQIRLNAENQSSLYDSDSGGNPVVDGGSVGRWENQQSSSFHATQATASYRPIYRKYKNVGGVYFDGVDDSLVGSFPSMTAQTVCLFGILNIAGSTANGRLFTQRDSAGSGDDTQTNHYIPYVRQSLTSNGLISYASSGYRSALAQSGRADNIYYMAFHTGSQLSQRANGVTSTPTGHTFGTYNQYSIGAGFSNANPFNALLFEVCVFNKALSGSEITSMETYYKQKFGWAGF